MLLFLSNFKSWAWPARAGRAALMKKTLFFKGYLSCFCFKFNLKKRKEKSRDERYFTKNIQRARAGPT